MHTVRMWMYEMLCMACYGITLWSAKCVNNGVPHIIHVYAYAHAHVYVYVYVYVCMCVCVCVYMYIYIYINKYHL